jgi:hypothetical protein
MTGWQRLLNDNGGLDANSLKKCAAGGFDIYQVYPDSIHSLQETLFFIARHEGKKALTIVGDGSLADGFTGEVSDFSFGNAETDLCKVKICPLDVANSKALFEAFPFTRPQTQKGRQLSIGLGDRLGLAAPGHLRAIKGHDVFPVLAQQSIRELNLTGRTYEEVLAAAAWGVFQEGYTGGYGADGDHLKTREEIIYALNCGYTRITLDCSDHIKNDVLSFSEAEIEKHYQALSADERSHYESKYLNRTVPLDDDVFLQFVPEGFKRRVLLYHKAIHFMIDIFRDLIEPLTDKPDFEISIDETLTETSPEDHFFVASELLDANVVFDSLAPRFCGKFEKGIDYIGSTAEFDKTLEIHLKIAKKLSYRVSVHSGSDKFSIFPFIGEKAEGIYHLKTAGTHWLEALRVVARHDPGFFRRIHTYAMEHLDEARAYYSISTDISLIPDVNLVPDSQLPAFLEEEPSRQVLHITYGLILTAKNSDGSYAFKDELYQFLYEYESQYDATVAEHLKKHMNALGIVK